jgi:hypothetical protein
MTNALAETPGIGHNSASLGELLTEEIAPLKERAGTLIAVARTAVIVDDESAAKVIDLGQMLAALEKELDDAREARGRPFLEATRTINGTYNPLIEQLAIVRAGPLGSDKKRRGGLRGMLQAFKDKREAEAEAQRLAAAAEQRLREEAAAEARRAAEQSNTLGDQLAAMKAQEDAAAAARRASAIRPEPVRAQLGSLGSRREIAFEVSSYPKALGWLLKVRKTEAQTALKEIIAKQLRSMGVDAVEAGVQIPGVEARIETTAAIRR